MKLGTGRYEGDVEKLRSRSVTRQNAGNKRGIR
jgi:hypothetical protein